MTAKDEEDTAPGAPGEEARGRARPQAAKSPSKVRRVAFWGALFAVLYGLTLFVLVDDWFLLAIPGLLGMGTLGAIFSTAVLDRSSGEAVPYPTDGTDFQGPVKYHRSVLVKRYLLIVAVVAVIVAFFVVMKSDYLIPLAPLAAMTFVFATRTCISRLLTLSQISRALKVYTFAFRPRAKALNEASGGKRVLRLRGSDGQDDSPKLLASQLTGQRALSDGLAGGVWFAGDVLFGGVLLVPGSGELLWVQPQDPPALQRERESVAPERKDMAKRAGLGRALKQVEPEPVRHRPA